MRYEVCRPRIVDELIDGEVVIVNLESGSYFSLRGIGAEVWDTVRCAASVASLTAALRSRYDSPPSLEHDLTRLIDELVEEGLVVPATSGEAPLPSWDGPAQAYASPVLEKFSDMEDLLLLDPVHDVDAQGWPHLAPPA